MQSLEFRFKENMFLGSGFRALSLGFHIKGSAFRVQGARCREEDLGFLAYGSDGTGEKNRS